jgi:hypothetical protein
MAGQSVQPFTSPTGKALTAAAAALSSSSKPGDAGADDVDFAAAESMDLFTYKWNDDADQLRHVEQKICSGLGDTQRPKDQRQQSVLGAAEQTNQNSGNNGNYTGNGNSRSNTYNDANIRSNANSVDDRRSRQMQSENNERVVQSKYADLYDDMAEDDHLLTRERLAILWVQLITTGNAMAIVCTEAKRYEDALYILQKAERWAVWDDVLSVRQRRNARAHVHDAFASFFFRRTRAHAALHHTQLAMELHESLGNLECVAVDLLHISAIECQLGQFVEAHKVIENHINDVIYIFDLSELFTILFLFYFNFFLTASLSYNPLTHSCYPIISSFFTVHYLCRRSITSWRWLRTADWPNEPPLPGSSAWCL